MANNSIDELPVSDDEKAKIAVLGVDDVVALFAMIKAAPESFETYFGSERTEQLVSYLVEHMSEEQLDRVNVPVPRFNVRGAIIGKPAAGLKPPTYDVNERDQLFGELQALRRQGDMGLDAQRRISSLEQRLNTILEQP